jgi:hypothetical protein
MTTNISIEVSYIYSWYHLRKHVALQDPSCFNLQKTQNAQETGSLYRMFSMTN